MVAGHLREKNGYYHMVLNYVDEYGKRHTPSKSTGLTVKGNKKRAEKMLSVARAAKEAELEARAIERSTCWHDSFYCIPARLAGNDEKECGGNHLRGVCNGYQKQNHPIL